MTAPPKYSKPEVERRWTVSLDEARLLAPERTRRIEDKYIQSTRLRLRQVHEDGEHPIFKLGKKYGRSPHSEEAVVSVYLSQAEYETLNELPGSVAIKRRHRVASGSLDLYELPSLPFAIFEVEFPSAEDAAAFSAPAFVSEEVTGNEAFSGFTLANSGA